jgi:hypothetical protein
MSASHFNDPAHWRERAAEMRQLVQGVNDSGAKKTMLWIAADYDRLAERRGRTAAPSLRAAARRGIISATFA